MELAERLEQERSLPLSGYQYLIENRTSESAAYLAERAVCARRRVYGNHVYVRGLIEISNI